MGDRTSRLVFVFALSALSYLIHSIPKTLPTMNAWVSSLKIIIIQRPMRRWYSNALTVIRAMSVISITATTAHLFRGTTPRNWIILKRKCVKRSFKPFCMWRATFPIIRFDAAMTLAKKHIQRLWFPEPGSGGAIPSRAEHGMTRSEFDAAMPEEFWREVVDRVAAEVPDTLLLAEAFWLLEGYFVRTLGMHRVYNSAFMHMLRDEDNAKYRMAIKNTLEFDPQILKRYVNFMNNPDEKTAVEQFGNGDKYFGVATVLSTLPGLPMFGHGQIEGFREKYGMEFRKPKLDENSRRWFDPRPRMENLPAPSPPTPVRRCREFSAL